MKTQVILPVTRKQRSANIPASAAIAEPPTPIKWMWRGVAGIRSRRALDSGLFFPVALLSSGISAALANCSLLLSALFFAEHLHYQVVNAGAQLPNGLIVAARMDPISQQ